MINLLPPAEKEEILIKKNERLIISLGSVLLIPLICLIMLLFALKFYVLGEIISQEVVFGDIDKKYQTADFLSSKESIQKYNLLLVKINNFYKEEIYFSDALKAISEIKRSDGLYLNSIIIKKGDDNDGFNVSISGVSNTRNNLLIFKSNIENDRRIKNINFPPDYLTKPVNITFNLIFEFNPPKQNSDEKQK